ncbi:MAG: hypothetical protein RBS91_05970 [Sulfurimonadaceae bacterium]|jgi:hypothetical protein|nr:hypothetical protein [Sulfurimonadaceae bacterium]
MFISSYATYIAPSLPSQKPEQSRSPEPKEKTDSFSRTQNTKVLSQNPAPLIATDISKARFLVALEPKEQEQSFNLYKKAATNKKADNAYKENSTPFKFSLGLPFTLDAKPLSVDRELQNLSFNTKKADMINTYIANDAYFRVTRG